MLKQEQLLRKVTEIGNGAHVFAPKEWIGEEVFIVRTPKKNLKEKIL
jgi:putative transposon-encoded protein